MEKWKDIDGFPGYQVSNTGNVRSFIKNRYGVGKTSHMLSPYVTKLGYKSVQMGRGRRKSVHRLVAEAYIPNPKNYPLVRHLDDNPSNNRVENLAWGTQKDNMQDCVRNGRLVGNTEAAIKSRQKAIVAISKDGSTRRVFPSIQEAARSLDLWPQHISSVLIGRISQTGGWKFEYLKEVD